MVLQYGPGDKIGAAQMNAELRHAQLEILSAQCATDRLRLRYSANDLARYAQRDILRKAWSSACALFEYYNAAMNQFPGDQGVEKPAGIAIEEGRILDASDRLMVYLREQGEYFRPIGEPLRQEQRDMLAPFFSSDLLAQVRVVSLERERIPEPPLDSAAKAIGAGGLVDFAHPFAATFENVLVFHDEVTARRLFHALIHAVQIETLGLGAYAERLVRGFLRKRAHASVPLELHATLLETGFGEYIQPFSVEEKVRLWMNQGRY